MSRRQWLTAVLSHHRTYRSVYGGSLNTYLIVTTLRKKIYHLLLTTICFQHTLVSESFSFTCLAFYYFLMFHNRYYLTSCPSFFIVSYISLLLWQELTSWCSAIYLYIGYFSNNSYNHLLDSIQSRSHTVSVNTFISSTRHIYYINLV